MDDADYTLIYLHKHGPELRELASRGDELAKAELDRRKKKRIAKAAALREQKADV